MYFFLITNVDRKNMSIFTTLPQCGIAAQILLISLGRLSSYLFGVPHASSGLVRDKFIPFLPWMHHNKDHVQNELSKML